MKLVRTLNGHTERIKPIWIMRQAGRYLPEYRALRAKSKNFMEFCLSKDMVFEATLQPIQRIDFDAAIIFSDILVIPHFLGQFVAFQEGVGPILGTPDWEKILEGSISDGINVVYESIAQVRENLDPEKALIGFVGCPWTIATYMINQGKTDNFSSLVNFCKSWPLFDKLMEKLTIIIGKHAVAQIKAGANVIQLFESWASAVPTELQEEWLFKPAKTIVEHTQKCCSGTNVIYYGKGIVPNAIKSLGLSKVAFGVSQDIPLDLLESQTMCLQGNLDPEKLLNGNFKNDVQKILAFSKNRPFIVNLGHGILPGTPTEHVKQFIDLVRQGA